MSETKAEQLARARDYLLCLWRGHKPGGWIDDGTGDAYQDCTRCKKRRYETTDTGELWSWHTKWS